MLEFRRMDEAVISRARRKPPPPPPPLHLPSAVAQPALFTAAPALPSSSATEEHMQMSAGLGRQRGNSFAASLTRTALLAQPLSYDDQFASEEESYTVAPPVFNTDSRAASALPVALDDFLDVNHLVQLAEEFERDFSAEQQRQEEDALPVEERIRRRRDREAERAAVEAAAAERQHAQAERQRTEQGQRAAPEDGSSQSAEDEAARRALEVQAADAQVEADEAAWMGQSNRRRCALRSPDQLRMHAQSNGAERSSFALAACTSSSC
jgi:hypothetical protein